MYMLFNHQNSAEFYIFRASDFNFQSFSDCLKGMEGEHNFQAFCSSQGWTKHIKLPDGTNVSEQRTEEEFYRRISNIGKVFMSKFVELSVKVLTTFLSFDTISILRFAFLVERGTKTK